MPAQQADAADRAIGEAFARFERAERTNAKCAAKELAIRDEFRQIERRKVELATMRKMNRGQRNVWLQDLTEKTVIPYSKAWNCRLAEQIQTILPLELRSIVYSYLLDDDTWDDYECQFLAVTSVLSPDIEHCRCIMEFQGLPRVPHFLLPEYMGSEAALEIVEKVYSNDWFKDKTLHGPTAELKSLIHKDPFGAGFDPAARIRNLSIVCVVDRYRLPRRCDGRGKTCYHTPYERRYIDGVQLKSEFSHLLGVVHNRDFRSLEVTFVQRNVRIDVLEEALETFTDVYQAFRSAGAIMRVQWKYSSATCGSESPHAHSRNLGKFFNEPCYTWKHRMLQFLQKVEPCMEARHVRFIDEPSLGLSDADFVHRMWGAGETFDATDDEDEETDGETDGEYWDSDWDVIH